MRIVPYQYNEALDKFVSYYYLGIWLDLLSNTSPLGKLMIIFLAPNSIASPPPYLWYRKSSDRKVKYPVLLNLHKYR